MRKLKERKETYYNLSSKISTMSNQELTKLVKKGRVSEGWGGNSLIRIAQKKIFVKTVPLTQKEYENSFDTSNI